jgi:hypothetical protein
MSYRTTSSITVVPAPARRSFDTGPGATGFPGPGHPGNAHLYRAEPGFTAGSHDLGALQGLGTVTGRPPPPAYLTLDDSSEENGPVFAPSRTWASTRVFPADNALLQQAGQLSQRLADILARMERGDSLATVVRFERMLQDLGLRVTAEQINGPLALSSGPRNLDVAPERPLELMLPPQEEIQGGNAAAAGAGADADAGPAGPAGAAGAAGVPAGRILPGAGLAPDVGPAPPASPDPAGRQRCSATSRPRRTCRPCSGRSW